MRRLLGVVVLAVAPAWAARHAMVVTVEPHATDAGVRVLQSGGNAVDAAVAVGLALAVTHPSAGNLGGGGFMLVRMADGRASFIDFRERAPAAASRNMYLGPDGKPTRDSIAGYRAPGVPGSVRGFEYAARKYGSKPWSDLVAPAEDLAARGFPVSPGLARSLLHSERLPEFLESRRIFQRNGRFYEPGEAFVQPELARTLDRLRREGARDFYEGETARLLAADMAAHHGLITLRDLKDYRVTERKPLTGRYRGYDILTAPPPSSGGIGILQMMGVLEGTDYARSGAGSAASLHWLAEAMRRYFADRSEYLGDPDFAPIPVAALLNPRYIEALRASIDPLRATPSTQVRPGRLAPYESSETTHYSIVDAEGNAAAVTYTLNGGYGSGVTPAGLGFLLNDEMDDFAAQPGAPNMFGLIQGERNAIAPHKIPLSSMTPTMVLRGGKLYLVVGTPGGPTIINTVLQVILNVLDFGMNLQEAVQFPRIHHQWMPDVLEMERGFPPDTVSLLEERGYRIHLGQSIGEVAAVRIDGGRLEGAADQRTEGTAKGY